VSLLDAASDIVLLSPGHVIRYGLRQGVFFIAELNVPSQWPVFVVSIQIHFFGEKKSNLYCNLNDILYTI